MGGDGDTTASSNFVAAGLASLFARATLYPLDTLRTRRQAPPSSLGTPPRTATAALWTGFLPSAAGAVPAQALYYSTYSALKPALGVAPAAAAANIVAALLRVPPELVKQRAQAGTANSAVYETLSGSGRSGLVGGAAAGAAAAIVTAPLDLLKTRAMLADGSRATQVSFRDVLKTEGGTVFWKGVGLRIAYKVCSSALFFAAVETFKKAAPVVRRKISEGFPSEIFTDYWSATTRKIAEGFPSSPRLPVKAKQPTKLSSFKRRSKQSYASAVCIL